MCTSPFLLLMLVAFQDHSGPDRASFDALIRQLGNDSAELRDQATLDLIKMGRGILPRALSVLKNTRDLEIKARLKRVSAELEGLNYLLRIELRSDGKSVFRRGRLRLGTFIVRFINISERNIRVVPSVCNFQTPRGYPIHRASIRKEDGQEVARASRVHWGSCDRLEVGDVLVLEPGGSVDLSADFNSFLATQALAQGTYLIRYVYDTSEQNPNKWVGVPYLSLKAVGLHGDDSQEKSNRRKALVESVDKGLVQSNQVVIKIER